MSLECFTYKGEAIRHIHSRLALEETATNELTIGAILVLTGVEVSLPALLQGSPPMFYTYSQYQYRVGSRAVHETHMSGLAKLLRVCAASNITLHASTYRTIFW